MQRDERRDERVVRHGRRADAVLPILDEVAAGYE